MGQPQVGGEGDEPHVLLPGLPGLLVQLDGQLVGNHVVVLGVEDQDRTLEIGNISDLTEADSCTTTNLDCGQPLV